jgi:glycolate oxidase FAD binding subunit
MNPGALTLVARAGTPLAEVEAALAAEGQRLAFEPPDHARAAGHAAGHATIGGVVAANASGPRRVQVGAAGIFCWGCGLSMVRRGCQERRPGDEECHRL